MKVLSQVPQQFLDTDEVMFNIRSKLLDDMVVCLPDTVFPNGLRETVRGIDFPSTKFSDPYVFKWKYQIRSLYKRYITKADLQNKDEVKRATYAKFCDTQKRVGSLPPPQKLSTLLVLQLARRKIKALLGEFDDEAHLSACRFGRRAAVGLPYRESYLDKRVESLTGSKQHISWFSKSVLQSDDGLHRACKNAVWQETTRLKLSDVPKAWDKKRTIEANTVIGGFHSAGIGDYMVSKLKEGKYNLGRRAEKHRALVKGFSRDLTHVTADLSAASDSFSWSLMNRLFPRSWYRAMKFGMIRQCEILGKTTYLTSFMTMGMGFTFPAQTIAFLCILRAIRQLTHSKGTVSVFGDDLIYPTQMHSTVVSVLTDAGFILNMEKTFVDTPFRESCGSDFYDGVAVRPFQPEGSHELLRGLSGLSYLYKMYNGLCSRWSVEELPNTLDYLRKEMFRFTERLHQVPSNFPETAGIRTDFVLPGHQYKQPFYDENGCPAFQAISSKLRLRQVPLQIAYLWDTLRRSVNHEEPSPWDRIEDSTVLIWQEVKSFKRDRYGNRRRVVRLIPHVSAKGSNPRYREQLFSAFF